MMGRNRFKFLFNNLMFDDVATQEVDWQQDRFTTIREFFEIFNRNCMKHVIPSEYLSIDETLYPMRTQVRIKQYNPNKRARIMHYRTLGSRGKESSALLLCSNN